MLSRGSGPGPAQSSSARGGGAGWSQKAKPSHWDSVLANGMRGASVSGRGDLGGVGEVQLWGVGVVIGLVSSRGAGFAHLVTFSPLSFSHPFPTLNPPLSNPLTLLPNPVR